VNSVLHVAYHENWIKLTFAPEGLTTSKLNLVLIDKMRLHGWEPGQPCEVTIFSPPAGIEPSLEVTNTTGLNFTITLALDFQCRKDPSSEFS